MQIATQGAVTIVPLVFSWYPNRGSRLKPEEAPVPAAEDHTPTARYQSSDTPLVEQGGPHIYVDWTSLTDHLEDLNPRVRFHFNLTNTSGEDVVLSDAAGRTRLDDQEFNQPIELEETVRIRAGRRSLLTVVQRLSRKETSFVNAFRSQHYNERGRRYDFSKARVGCLSASGRRHEVKLPDPNIRNR